MGVLWDCQDGGIEMAAVSVAVALALAYLLVSSGTAKIRVGTFAADVVRYRILPPSMVVPVADALPWLEVLVALGLVSGLFTSTWLIVAGSLMLAFATAVAVNLLRGRRVPCGCRACYSPSRPNCFLEGCPG